MGIMNLERHGHSADVHRYRQVIERATGSRRAGEREREREYTSPRTRSHEFIVHCMYIYNGVGNFSEIVRGQLTNDLKIRVKVILTFFFFLGFLIFLKPISEQQADCIFSIGI